MSGSVKITLVRSTIGQKPKIRATVESLGLRKIRQSVERPDSASLRGMINSARHLLDVEETP
jgi:large subunit ribosomal protein L30